MARKKPRFRCHKCKNNLGSAATSFEHFKKHPSHRTERQLKDFKANLALRERGGKPKAKRRVTQAGLPTIKVNLRGRSTTDRYCTECGTRKMPSHNYCGGCGDKL